MGGVPAKLRPSGPQSLSSGYAMLTSCRARRGATAGQHAAVSLEDEELEVWQHVFSRVTLPTAFHFFSQQGQQYEMRLDEVGSTFGPEYFGGS